MTILSLLGLLLVGCQPYPDHGEAIYDFRSDSEDFGLRRELKIARHKGDAESLLLEFNQPLHQLKDEGSVAPFVPVFQPRVPLESVTREGVAGVRVKFREKLPPAQRFTVSIPQGWRALTGAAYLGSEPLFWNTELPALEKVETAPGLDNWEPSKSLQLHFNQSVHAASVEEHLRFKTVPGGEEVEVWPLSLQPSSGHNTDFLLALPNLPTQQRYKIYMAEGLKSAEGHLPGEEGEGFFFGPRPAFVLKSPASQVLEEGAPLILEFSKEVRAGDLERHLKGLDWSAAYFRTEDSIRYELHWAGSRATGPRPRHLTLLGGVKSVGGERLGSDVELELTYPERRTISHPSREFSTLRPGTTVLEMATSKETSVSSWRLTGDQLLKLLALPAERWSDKKKLPLELKKPIYSVKLKKSRGRTRFLKAEKPDSKPALHGAYLVRTTTKDGVVTRRLIQRSDLVAETFSLNGLLNYHVESRRSGAPVQGGLLQVLAQDGKLLLAGQTTADGDGSVSSDKIDDGYYIRVKKGKDSLLRRLTHLDVRTQKSVSTLLWADGAVYESGGKLNYFGLWWATDERPAVVVKDAQGELVECQAGPAEKVGHFFRGQLTLPEAPGDYFLDLPSDDFSTPSFRFTVTDHPVVHDHPSTLQVEFAEDEKHHLGNYLWDGPGANHLDVRASLRPHVTNVGRWSSTIVGRPHWMPVSVEHDTTLEGGDFVLDSLPELNGAWDLVVELFDRRDKGRVFRRHQIRLAESPIELANLELKHTQADVRLAKFQFEFTKNTPQVRRTLQCRLELREGEQWRVVSESDALLRDGRFEWSGAVTGSGRVRLSVSWTEDEQLAGEAAWEATLESDSVADWEPLDLSTEVVVSRDPVSMTWPGLEEGLPVWVRAYAGKSLLTAERRLAGPEGDLGELSLQKLRAGSREVTIVVSRTDNNAQVRANRLRVLSSAHFLPASLAVAGQLGPVELDPRETFKVKPDQGELAPQNVMFWWEQSPQLARESDAETVLEQMLESTHHPMTTLHGTLRSPLKGPTVLNEAGEIELVAPVEAGDYNLYYLGDNEDHIFHFAKLGVKIKESAEWETVTPIVIRPGDLFSAGVRFHPDPAIVTPTGANTGVELDSTLLPTSYFSTSALVDPGSEGDMLFFYRAPAFIAPAQLGDFLLKWSLGVEGEALPVEARLNPLPTRVRQEPFLERVLTEGEAARFSLSRFEHWQAELSTADGSASLSLTGLPEGETELTLESVRPLQIVGDGESNLEVRHGGGQPVKIALSALYSETGKEGPRAVDRFLMRRLEKFDGSALGGDGVLMNSEYLLSYHLVAPDELEESILTSPIPGGLEPAGCWLKEPTGVTPLNWRQVPGSVEVEIPKLPTGEHEVLIACFALVNGEFEWPPATLRDAEGAVKARTLRDKIKILEP